MVKKKKITTIEQLAETMQKGFAVSDLKIERLAQMTQGEFLNIRKEFSGHFSNVYKRLDRVENEVSDLRSEWQEFRKNASELFTKLDKFIAIMNDVKEEQAVMTRQLRRLEERVAQLEAKK